MVIRRAQTVDIPQLIPLLNDLDKVHYKWHPDMFVELPEGRTAADVAELFDEPQAEIWVAEEDRRVQGMVYLIHREIKESLVVRGGQFLLVDMLVVDERFRGRGIGKRLMEKARDVGRENGYGELKLKVLQGNEQAREWYRGLGYEPVYSQLRLQLTEDAEND